MIIQKLDKGYVVTTYGTSEAVTDKQELRNMMYGMVHEILNRIDSLSDEYKMEVQISGKEVKKAK